jgi:muramoyltetrapeptide carboxypeptidase
MERKSFMKLLGAGLLPFSSIAAATTPKTTRKIIIPPYLKTGDTIGITCPSGFSTLEDIQPAVQMLQQWGYQVKIGNTIGKRDFTFGGTDAERTADFQMMLDDTTVKAILCATGGYGAVRIIDQLNLRNSRKHPKWMIGFSDITVLHSHFHQVHQIATLHAKMCGSFPKDWAAADPVQQDAILSIQQALTGHTFQYPVQPCLHNRNGVAEGVLVGGNLRILENMNGSASAIDTKGKILFVEDVSEPLYNIDRMFCNLLRAGKLAHLKGLIVGGFTDMKPDNPASPFGRDVFTIVKEKTAKFNYPVCFDFPVGHQKSNFALKCGVKHRLTVSDITVSLTEIS